MTRLKNGTRLTFGDLNLRYFVFSRWSRYARISQSIETLDYLCVSRLVRNGFGFWKRAVFGLGLKDQLHQIVAATSSKIAESFAVVEEDSIPAVQSSNSSWTESVVSRFFKRTK
jgi:hypothetical protein